MTKKNIEDKEFQLISKFFNKWFKVYTDTDTGTSYFTDRDNKNNFKPFQAEDVLPKLEELLSRHRSAILEEILKFVKERKQTLDVGFRVPGEKYKGLYDWEDLINYLTKLKDEDY